MRRNLVQNAVILLTGLTGGLTAFALPQASDSR